MGHAIKDEAITKAMIWLIKRYHYFRIISMLYPNLIITFDYLFLNL